MGKKNTENIFLCTILQKMTKFHFLDINLKERPIVK